MSLELLFSKQDAEAKTMAKEMLPSPDDDLLLSSTSSLQEKIDFFKEYNASLDEKLSVQYQFNADIASTLIDMQHTVEMCPPYVSAISIGFAKIILTPVCWLSGYLTPHRFLEHALEHAVNERMEHVTTAELRTASATAFKSQIVPSQNSPQPVHELALEYSELLNQISSKATNLARSYSRVAQRHYECLNFLYGKDASENVIDVLLKS